MPGLTSPSRPRLWPGRLQTSIRTTGARPSAYFGTFRAPRTFTSPPSQTSHVRRPTSTICASSATPTGL
eukprot:3527748-Alexandrium_andersonii.AAC.1